MTLQKIELRCARMRLHPDTLVHDHHLIVGFHCFPNRQTSAIKQDYHWTNTDYANIVVAFRVAYSIGRTLCGRVMDRVGTKRGWTTVLWYTIVSILTPLARGFYSFLGFRFLLGAGEWCQRNGRLSARSSCSSWPGISPMRASPRAPICSIN
jgi:MFS family permease